MPPMVFVAPDGTGDGGSPERPADLHRAQSLVRDLIAVMTEDVVVELAEGVYRLDRALEFTAADSGRDGHRVHWRAAPGARPVLSGGRVIEGWRLTDAARNIWSADVPAALRTRQLYVDGVRARRARSAAGLPDGSEVTATGFVVPGAELQAIENPTELEFVFRPLDWIQQRCGVAAVEGTQNRTVITMKQPGWDTVEGWIYKAGLPDHLENAYAFLEAPGDWYLDVAAGRLHYLPRAGQVMASTVVVVPVLEQLLVGSGTPAELLCDLTFEGLTFAETTWLGPSGDAGLAEIQANLQNPDPEYARNLILDHFVSPTGGGTWQDHPWGSGLEMTPSAVQFHTARRVHLTGNTFVRLGACGLGLDQGSQDNLIVGNTFTDISGNGLQVGSVRRPNREDPRDLDRGNRITNNYVHAVAAEYQGGVGMYFAYVTETLIAHNEIAWLPYTGISIGWGWGSLDTLPTASRDNQIVHNHVHDVMLQLNDGAGIYGLGPQPGGLIAGNLIENITGDADDPRTRYRMGIYLDQGSTGWQVRGNAARNLLYWLDNNRNPFDPADIVAVDNHTDTPAIFRMGGMTVDGTAVLAPDQLPAAIVESAGLEPRYRLLRDR